MKNFDVTIHREFTVYAENRQEAKSKAKELMKTAIEENDINIKADKAW